MDRQINRHADDRAIDIKNDRTIDGWMDGWINRQTDENNGWKDGCMDRQRG